MARARYLKKPIFAALLLLMQPENAEALRISLDYGVRIGDILKMTTASLHSTYWSFKESKTGKRRRVRLSATHKEALFSFAGKIYVFEHRTDPTRHRTRQTVYKDVKRLAMALGYKGISPHSARKIYAVSAYHKTGDLAKVQKLLNHSDPTVTALYALADEMEKKPPQKRKHSAEEDSSARQQGTSQTE